MKLTKSVFLEELRDFLKTYNIQETFVVVNGGGSQDLQYLQEIDMASYIEEWEIEILYGNRVTFKNWEYFIDYFMTVYEVDLHHTTLEDLPDE